MRRILSAIVVLLVLALGGDFLLWRWAQGRLDAAFAVIANAGWTVTASPVRRSGWPFAATSTVSGFSIAGADSLAWSTGQLVLSVSLLHPTLLVIDAMGPQLWRFGAAVELATTAEQLQAAVPLERAGPPWPFSLQARGIDLPPGRSWPFGPQVAVLRIDAALDAGGAIEVDHLAVRWGRLDASGHATIGLDERRQPSGTGMVRIVDPSAALAELVANGVLAGRAAFAANAMLALMTHAAPDGGAPVVELPLALADQRLSIGRIPIATIKPFSWPAEP